MRILLPLLMALGLIYDACAVETPVLGSGAVPSTGGGGGAPSGPAGGVLAGSYPNPGVAAQTGTGSTFVMNTSPTLVTPILGAASATSVAVSGAVTAGSVTDSGLTSGRIPVAGTAGLLGDFSTFTYTSGSGISVDGITLADAKNIAFNTTTGTKIGTATNQKLAFYNSTPVIQPSGDALTALGTLGLLATGTLTAADITLGTLATARGGTNVDGSSAANGKLLIGNGSGYTLANITAGTGIGVTNGSGSITLAVSGLIEHIDGMIETPSAKDYVVTLSMPYAVTINDICISTLGGTLTANVKIGSTSITSLSAISVTSTPQTVTATGANTMSSGDKLLITVTSPSSANDLYFTIKETR